MLDKADTKYFIDIYDGLDKLIQAFKVLCYFRFLIIGGLDHWAIGSWTIAFPGQVIDIQYSYKTLL